MPDNKPKKLSRSQLPEDERRLRSQIARLVTNCGLVRGTLNVREKVCGRRNCRCARGERHRSVSLVASENGRLRQLYVPGSLERTAEQWVETYKRIRELLEELSQMQWDKLKRREP